MTRLSTTDLGGESGGAGGDLHLAQAVRHHDVVASECQTLQQYVKIDFSSQYYLDCQLYNVSIIHIMGTKGLKLNLIFLVY